MKGHVEPKREFRKIRSVPNLYRREVSGVYYLLVKRNGRQFRRSLKTSDFALAKRRLREFEDKASRLGGSRTNKQLRFEELAERWLANIRPDLKPSSYARRVVGVKALTPFFRGEVVTKIGARHIEAWKIKRAALISAQTANIEAETLRLIFRYALNDLRLLIENPAESIKRRKVRSAERLIPTKEDFRRLVAELRSGHKATGEAADFVEFLAYSGMRRAEAACVCWRDEKRHLENQFPDDILALKEYIELGERELMDESVERLRRIVEDLRSSSDNDDDTNATEKGP